MDPRIDNPAQSGVAPLVWMMRDPGHTGPVSEMVAAACRLGMKVSASVQDILASALVQEIGQNGDFRTYYRVLVTVLCIRDELQEQRIDLFLTKVAAELWHLTCTKRACSCA